MKECGLDTIFHIFDAPMNSEIYLLTDWGSVNATTMSAWVGTLRSSVPNPDGTLLPMCNYDLDNLKRSGKAILNSITLALWEIVEKDLRVNTTGPKAFVSIISKL
jgi:hypothetical protein